MISAWARMCKILGKEFQQYLPVVMGPLMKTASIKPEVALLDSECLRGHDSGFCFMPCFMYLLWFHSCSVQPRTWRTFQRKMDGNLSTWETNRVLASRLLDWRRRPLPVKCWWTVWLWKTVAVHQNAYVEVDAICVCVWYSRCVMPKSWRRVLWSIQSRWWSWWSLFSSFTSMMISFMLGIV